jgi:hypothetical protein
MNNAGKTKRFNHHLNKPKDSLCRFNDKSYYFLYPAHRKDTIELMMAFNKIIPIIKTRRFSNSLKSHKVVMFTDSTGTIETDQAKFRDYGYDLDFNLNKGEIHFITCTGF